jgi:hypothetical protein
MRLSDLRVGLPAWVALAAIVTRDPLLLGLTALGLLGISRVSSRVVFAATGSTVILYFAAGAAPALRYFLVVIVTALGSQHVRIRKYPEWWKELQGAIEATTSRFKGRAWRSQIAELRLMLPVSPRRRVFIPAEISIWAILLLPLAGAAWSRTSSSEGFVVTHPGGRLELERRGEYRIAGPAGGLIVEFDGSRARVIDAGCPEKRCVRQGAVDNGVIVCVPNRVVIRRRASREDVVDAWTG